MSKEAAQRAMREARYAQRMARAGAPRAAREPAPVAPPAGAVAKKKPAAAAAPAAAPAAAGETCGHRSMNGRSCTREAGHAAKNHRYS